MRYLEHFLLTYRKRLMCLSWPTFCETKCLQFVSVCFKNDTGLPLNQKQRTKIGSSYSIWEDIASGVSQGSILGPLLLNIFLCDFFLECGNNYFTNYAYNTKIYNVDENTKEALTNRSTLTQKIYIHGSLTINQKRTTANAFEYSGEHLHSNRVLYSKIL